MNVVSDNDPILCDFESNVCQLRSKSGDEEEWIQVQAAGRSPNVDYSTKFGKDQMTHLEDLDDNYQPSRIVKIM